MRLNVHSSAVLVDRSTSLHSYFIWTGLSSTNHSWHQKTRDTGLPDGEDHIPLCSLVLTEYRSVAHRWRDGFAVAYTALCKPSFAKTTDTKYLICISSMQLLLFFIGRHQLLSKLNCHFAVGIQLRSTVIIFYCCELPTK